VPRGVGGKTWGHPQVDGTSLPGEVLPQTIQGLFFQAFRNQLRIMWTGYTETLFARPVLVTSITAGLMYGIGDFSAQKIERVLGIQSKGKTSFNYERFTRMAVFGGFIAGPLLAIWYPMLHRMTMTYRLKYLPSFTLFGKNFFYTKQMKDGQYEKFVEGAIKVMCDNLFFQPPFITLYLVTMGTMEGKSFSEVYQQTKKNFHDVWGYSFLVWIPAQAINFTFVPVPLQAFFVNMTNFFWKILMSLVYHQRDYGDHEEEAANGDPVAAQTVLLQLDNLVQTQSALEAQIANLQAQKKESDMAITKQKHLIKKQQIQIEALTEQGNPNVPVGVVAAHHLVDKSSKRQWSSSSSR